MATQRISVAAPARPELALVKVAAFPRMRVLAWDQDVLYVSRGYAVLRARIGEDADNIEWDPVGQLLPSWGRQITSSSRLTARLCRDGFHALAILSSGHLVAAVPKAIVTLAPGETEFRVSHRIRRGTRPLHIAATPKGQVFWGEYFDNPQREEIHIYASLDCGAHWDVAHTFPPGAVRHVHNIVYDPWVNCLWVLTGDDGFECQILRASCDFRNVDVVLSGSQQTRAVALVATSDAVYFSSDTPRETNHVYRLDRRGNLSKLAALSSSSIYGCRVGDSLLFSTMVEPSAVNRERTASVYLSNDGIEWRRAMQWQKDSWPMGWFQYGNVFLPDGNNTSGCLALTTVAVRDADLETSLWRVR